VPALAPIAQLAGSGIAAGGALAAGQQQQAIYNYNAGVERTNAATAITTSETNAGIIAQQTRARMGEASAAYGAGGVQMSGSPLAVMASLAAKGELNKQLVLFQGRTQSQADTAQSAIQTAEGTAASTAGAIRAGGSLLTGTGQFLSAMNAYGAGTSPAMNG
jgi:hypothetical protein